MCLVSDSAVLFIYILNKPSSNQSIINQFHSSGGAVLLQVLLVTCSSTVVDDSREQQRWRCFASRTHTNTHKRTLRTSSSHQLRATPGAAHRKQELFYPLLSSPPCARRDEWNFLLRGQRSSRLRRRSNIFIPLIWLFWFFTRARCGCQSGSRAQRPNRGTIVGFLFFFERVREDARRSTRAHSWGGSGSGTCQALTPQLVGRQAVRRTGLWSPSVCTS